MSRSPCFCSYIRIHVTRYACVQTGLHLYMCLCVCASATFHTCSMWSICVDVAYGTLPSSPASLTTNTEWLGTTQKLSIWLPSCSPAWFLSSQRKPSAAR